jgi:TMEM175 potassium channel family protein
MREKKITADRLAAYSDAVFAVIVTIMVLELKAPDEAAFSRLWPLWPTAISYPVSYLFIAIIWINHDHLMRFVDRPTLGLIWINFVHLFLVSLLPFATAWIARTRLASVPVACYAGLFVCIDIAYNVFEREVLVRADATLVSKRTRRMARWRSLGCPFDFHGRHAYCIRRASPRLRSDMRRADPALAARCPWQSAVTFLQSEIKSPSGFTNR